MCYCRCAAIARQRWPRVPAGWRGCNGSTAAGGLPAGDCASAPQSPGEPPAFVSIAFALFTPSRPAREQHGDGKVKR